MTHLPFLRGLTEGDEDDFIASPTSSKIRRASAPLPHAVDVHPLPFTSLERSTSAPALSSYFQSLFQSLQCLRPYSISIVSDNHATHSSASSINSSMPPLPTLDGYDPLDDFLPSLLEEKGITKPAEKLLILFGNASAFKSEPAVITPFSNGHQDATNTTLLADPLTKESEILQLDEEVEESDYYIDITFHDELKNIDSPSRLRHERSNSMDHLFSPCTSKSSVFVSSSTLEGDGNRLCFSPDQHRSPQSVLDPFGAEDTAELFSSFHSL